jgi:aerobic-type carbon monoxide dehydrogenase small subunit (CoxS/CutS family)
MTYLPEKTKRKRHPRELIGLALLAGEALLRRKPSPTREDVVEAVEGILCRCTGYRQIVDAVLDASKMKP